MAQIYNDVVDISKCHCYTVKIYFLPHENGITIAGNIFSHIYMERIYLLLLSKRQKMFFLSPLLYEWNYVTLQFWNASVQLKDN